METQSKKEINYSRKITIRELRALLFEVTDQDMTVRELRSRLFDANIQDAVVFPILSTYNFSK